MNAALFYRSLNQALTCAQDTLVLAREIQDDLAEMAVQPCLWRRS